MALWWEQSRCAPQSSVCALSNWVEKLWEQHSQHIPTSSIRRLSSTAQEIVWESILRQFSKERAVLRVLPTARLGIKAWQTLRAWGLELSDAEACAREDTRHFWNWAKKYRTWCEGTEEGVWLDTPGLWDAVTALIQTKTLLLPKQCLWVGFSEFTPQQEKFMRALRDAGVEVAERSLLLPAPQQVCVLGLNDADHELKSAMAWAVSQVAQGLQGHFSVAIVVPQLSLQRPHVARLAVQRLPRGSYNIAAPQMLSEYPVIQAALLGLSLGKTQLDFLTVSRFLRSPFYGDAHSEQHERARLELALRELGSNTLSWGQLLRASRRFPLLQNTLHTLAELRAQLRGRKVAREWVVLVRAWLQSLRWPGAHALTEEEQAIRLQWEAVLQEYEALAPLLGKHTFGTAVFRLNSLTRAMPYAVASRAEPIQILGLLEAAGLPFQRVWVMGLHQAAWPMEPAPNPFIPYEVQRQHDLPRSSASREYRVAQRLTFDLAKAAPVVVFSYPTQVEGQATQASPLLAPFPHLDEAERRIFQQNLEEFVPKTEDPQSHPLLLYSTPIDFAETAPAFPKTEEPVSGGTRVLALQGLCPFRAFAEIRLKARAWPRVHLGLSPAQRGMILHEILCVLWEKIKTQHALLQYSDEDLNQCIQQGVETILSHWQAEHSHRLSRAFFKMEVIRLTQLLFAWMQLEKQRPPFTVLATESNQKITIKGLTLKVRLDRVDDTGDTQRVIIDYKTDKYATVQAWLGEPLLEPQLPLYALTQALVPKAIAFAVVNPDALAFRGLGEGAVFPGVNAVPAWTEQMGQWRAAIEGLVTDFLHGEARVNPVEKEKTCQQCHLSSLCRVFEKHVS